MSLRAEILRLRQDLQRSFGRAEAKHVRRYGRLAPLERSGAYRRFRKAVGRILRHVGLRPASPPEPWHPGLKHAECGSEARPLVIWALGSDRDTLRAACRGFERLQPSAPGLAPVLVTDVADFAFYSRLGWLVEYVPSLGAPAGSYAERKRRYLAWRYRDAQVLPAAAGLDEHIRVEELQIG